MQIIHLINLFPMRTLKGDQKSENDGIKFGLWKRAAAC